jgi:uncharacterized membrane protein YbhN (UPF0104 family)
MRKYFNYFIYISLVFLLVALYRADYLVVPKIGNIPLFIFSILVLLSGFLSDAWGWQTALKKINVRVKFSDAIASFGLSVFGKYIPGKVWIIAGRAAYISKRYKNVSETDVLSVSFITQFVSLWVGLIYGAVALFVMDNVWIYILSAGMIWLGLTLTVFTKYPHQIIARLYKRILKKEFKVPYIPFKDAIAIVPVYILRWGAFALSFYLFVISLVGENVPIITGFAFPLATILGIVVLVAPGGLGVRETILVGFLKWNGLITTVATTISVVSRLWFLLAEISLFLLALIIHRTKRK